MNLRSSKDRFFRPHDATTSPRDISNYSDRLGLCFASPTSILVKTDGAYPENGSASAKASYGVYFGRDSPYNRCALLPMTERQTNNVTELYSLKMALRLFFQAICRSHIPPPEGINELIIATDSVYVVDSLCKWVWCWEENGWRNSNGEDVLNSRLISTIHDQIRSAELEHDIDVKFWRVTRESIVEARRLARVALENYLPGDFERTVCTPKQRWNHAGDYMRSIEWRLRNTDLTLSRVELPLLGENRWITSVKSYIIRQISSNEAIDIASFCRQLFTHLGIWRWNVLESEKQILSRERLELLSLRIGRGGSPGIQTTTSYNHIPGDSVLQKILHLDAILKRIDECRG